MQKSGSSPSVAGESGEPVIKETKTCSFKGLKHLNADFLNVHLKSNLLYKIRMCCQNMKALNNKRLKFLGTLIFGSVTSALGLVTSLIATFVALGNVSIGAYDIRAFSSHHVSLFARP